MANGDVEGRLKQLEQQAEEERIEQQVEARVGRQQPTFIPFGGGGPTVLSGGGGGFGSILAGLITVGSIGGVGYWAWQNGYLAFILGPLVKGPGIVQAGMSYKFGVVGLTSGSTYQYQVVFNDGSMGDSGSGTAHVDGTAEISLSFDESAINGKAQLQVTDQSSGKTGKKGFTITGGQTSTTTTGGGTTGGGTTGGSGNLHATGATGVLAGANYVVTVTGATPNSALKFELKTSAGANFALANPDGTPLEPPTDAKGNATVIIGISSSVSLGQLTFVITDLGTGQTTTLVTTVLPLYP